MTKFSVQLRCAAGFGAVHTSPSTRLRILRLRGAEARSRSLYTPRGRYEQNNAAIQSQSVQSTPYSELSIGVPKEVSSGERRVAVHPANVKKLLSKGFKSVLIEHGAGNEAQFSDEDYKNAGATLSNPDAIWKDSNILLKVRPPALDQDKLGSMRSDATLISMLYPLQPKSAPLVDALAKQGVTSFAMDMIPRISRAQSFDVLSSMANTAGYKAVLEAANHFPRFLTGQTTAAGKIPPCKVLIIGAGVAGLSAIATARRMGAIVRGFDTRSAAREQVESLGAEFIEVDVKESGDGSGGYAKVMSKEFIEAEMRLFMQQAKEVDIIITTALIPGKPAPLLITKDVSLEYPY